jgi:hypothetical protein
MFAFLWDSDATFTRPLHLSRLQIKGMAFFKVVNVTGYALFTKPGDQIHKNHGISECVTDPNYKGGVVTDLSRNTRGHFYAREGEFEGAR